MGEEESVSPPPQEPSPGRTRGRRTKGGSGEVDSKAGEATHEVEGEGASVEEGAEPEAAGEAAAEEPEHHEPEHHEPKHEEHHEPKHHKEEKHAVVESAKHAEPASETTTKSKGMAGITRFRRRR